MTPRQRCSLWIAGAALLCAGRAEAQFQKNVTQIPGGSPFNDSNTENVDFADIDLDGDWDAAFADGGDTDQDQSRLWLNQGFLQAGTIGFFTDVTSTRCPAVLHQSRDVEFVDFDNDSDVDLYVSNTSQILSQTNLWWRNNGPAPGSIGFYVDETAARWVGLGAPGSSIAPGAVIGSGGFRDWSCDCDFGDLDNDGDIDLVHSSYGGAFGGQVPTRLFLNDGSGFFTEFNPSGIQLAGGQITNGQPGIWCEGTQLANTTDATGLNCDVASTALDIDVSDIDGDLDLDILHGARQELPRMFVNRMEENAGVLTYFRDVTGAVFPAGYSSGGGHYEQEFGDFDDDGDIDVFGLNWQSSLSDEVLENDGTGTFGNMQILPSSESDDNEGDFFDYDSDGDLDLLIANFSGQERLYQNTDGQGTYVLTTGQLPSENSSSLDADAADVDGDGDYDAFIANDNHAPNVFFKNLNDVADTHAPKLYRLEHAPDRNVGPAPTVVRVQVYDNASYYTTWYADTQLEVQVNGGAVQTFAMQSSQGQIFRGEIPGNLAGFITYRAVSTDEHGNTGTTPYLSYVAGGTLGLSYCFGDGSLPTPCPCALPDTVPSPSGEAGHGCANSFNMAGAKLTAIGTTLPDTVQFQCHVSSNYVGFAFLAKGDASNAAGVASSDGIRCFDGAIVRFGSHYAATNGAPQGYWTYPNNVQTTPVSIATAQASGQSAHYQLFYRNAAVGFCNPSTANLSNAIEIPWP
jgi:hypothetical protein